VKPSPRWLVPQQATFAPVGVARPLRFGFLGLAAGPPSHWIVTFAGGLWADVWADAVTGLAGKAPLLLLPADPLGQPWATGQLCGRVNRPEPPADRGWAAPNRCRRGRVTWLWGDRALANRITRGPSTTCCAGVTGPGCGPPSSCSPSRLGC
jgi:hypothetical protein